MGVQLWFEKERLMPKELDAFDTYPLNVQTFVKEVLSEYVIVFSRFVRPNFILIF